MHECSRQHQAKGVASKNFVTETARSPCALVVALCLLVAMEALDDPIDWSEARVAQELDALSQGLDRKFVTLDAVKAMVGAQPTGQLLFRPNFAGEFPVKRKFADLLKAEPDKTRLELLKQRVDRLFGKKADFDKRSLTTATATLIPFCERSQEDGVR
jgi:hypothetical protein